MLKTVQCEQSHLEELQCNGSQSMCINQEDMKPDPKSGVTLLAGLKIVACGGVQETWLGVGCAWLVVSPELLQKHKVEVVKACVAFIAESLVRFHRIHCLVDAESSVNRRFVRWLGFHREGKLRKYTSDGKDLMLYAIVRDD